MNYDILVNKDHPLDKDYIPDDLVLYTEFNGIKLDPSIKTYVNKEALIHFNEMNKECKNLNYHFIVDSAYRSYDYQKVILQHEIKETGSYENAIKTVAIPGCSEHQTGLAIDVALQINDKYINEFNDKFEEIKWLHNNMYKFGFILRYPKNCEEITKISYEYWHIRYVGKDISIYMHENNINTLEEYINSKL